MKFRKTLTITIEGPLSAVDNAVTELAVKTSGALNAYSAIRWNLKAETSLLDDDGNVVDPKALADIARSTRR